MKYKTFNIGIVITNPIAERKKNELINKNSKKRPWLKNIPNKYSVKWNDKIAFDDGIRMTIDSILKQSRAKNLDNNALNSTPWKN